MLCQDDNPAFSGVCQSQGRWVGDDGLVRCSMHQIQKYGHGAPLVKSPDYEPPEGAPEPEPAPA